jgi:hypothetical protein
MRKVGGDGYQRAEEFNCRSCSVFNVKRMIRGPGAGHDLFSKSTSISLGILVSQAHKHEVKGCRNVGSSQHHKRSRCIYAFDPMQR